MPTNRAASSAANQLLAHASVPARAAARIRAGGVRDGERLRRVDEEPAREQRDECERGQVRAVRARESHGVVTVDRPASRSRAPGGSRPAIDWRTRRESPVRLRDAGRRGRGVRGAASRHCAVAMSSTPTGCRYTPWPAADPRRGSCTPSRPTWTTSRSPVQGPASEPPAGSANRVVGEHAGADAAARMRELPTGQQRAAIAARETGSIPMT